MYIRNALFLSALLGSVVTAEVITPAIFSDNMVLQRGTQVPVWGKADPGEKVTVTITTPDSQSVVARAEGAADEQGRWKVLLDTATAPATPVVVTLTGSTEQVINNVLVGQVWVCSGQSNMEWRVINSNDAKAEIAAADFPEIRHFEVTKRTRAAPTTELEGKWAITTPENVGQFTAVGYFFGRELHQRLGAPVGLIHTSWGGTPAEAWTSETALRPLKDFDQTLDALAIDPTPEALAAYEKELKAWRAKLPDEVTGEKFTEWADPDLDETEWKSAELPALIESFLGEGFNGSVWLRREVELDAAPAGPATLHLGPIDDFDVTYVNGQRVGGIGPEDANAWRASRRYQLPEGLLKAGRNVIAVRILDTGGNGGTSGSAAQLKLEVGEKSIPLAGQWTFRVEQPTVPNMGNVGNRPVAPGQATANSPAALYNGMVAPIIPYGIAGAIWYQGESNNGRAEQYRKLLPAMIEGWRSVWDQQGAPVLAAEGGRDFPFYIVQLANFLTYNDDPNHDNGWTHIQEAQAFTARTVPNSGLAVALDLGEEADIHPRNKQDVGRRLALVALAKTYGQADVESSGPTLAETKIDGDRAVLRFNHTTGGLQAKELAAMTPEPTTRATLRASDSPVKGFALRGADGSWHWAKARIIDEQTVEVRSAAVKAPVAVRYAWAPNPVANLYNGAGLPAGPFRTDGPVSDLLIGDDTSTKVPAIRGRSAPGGSTD